MKLRFSTSAIATLSPAWLGLAALCGGAFAQSGVEPPVAVEEVGFTATIGDPGAEIASTANASAAPPPGTIIVNPDEMADQLNSQQQLRQSFTLKRTIDGEVVESEKRTVTYDRTTPYRETEAGQTALEALKAAFDGELLTRTEAFSEAKLDFTSADADRDNNMTLEEFTNLVESWRNTDAKSASAPNKEIARQRQYEAFLAEIDPQAAEMQFDAHATQKFRFLAGASETISRKAYIRGYLLDFDSMDQDGDTLLNGNELLRFRALNRGETLDM